MSELRREQEMTSWKQHLRSSTSGASFSLLMLLISFSPTIPVAANEAKIYQKQNKLLDETQFSNPKSFDYNFEDDFKNLADANDVYDELVPYLPTFILHKNGKNVGRTSVPIITRKMPAWSTPLPRQKYVEPYRSFSSKSLEGLHRSSLKRPTTLVTRSTNQRLMTRRTTTTTRTVRTTTVRSFTFKQKQQQRQSSQRNIGQSSRNLSKLIRPAISNDNNIVNNNNRRRIAANVLDNSLD
uniref:Uncharacterized protein n=1 Tax=Setaria digitata TaxID=48799 RepID=A0A915PNY7_9BILA